MWTIKTKVAIPVLLCTDVIWMFLKEIFLDSLKIHIQREGAFLQNKWEILLQSNQTTVFS